MKVLCLTDFPVKPPDRWIWNYLPDPRDHVDFLWAQPSDRFGQLGKVVTRYPTFWKFALRTLWEAAAGDYDLLVVWESKTGIPLALLRRLFSQTRPPLVVLTFTPGETPPISYPLIRYALDAVDHVTVITRAEIETYQRLFHLSHSKISLCLLGMYDVAHLSECPSYSGMPFVHASGRSARDYRTLINAARDLSVRVVIHGRGYNFRGLDIPANVSIGEFVPHDQYYRLVKEATIEVVPLQDVPAPVGSSQVVFAMMMGKPIVATRTASTVDYIEHGKTGLLVKSGNPEEMRAAIQYLLDHPSEAEAMGKAARRRFEESHTFERFAQNTYRILQEVYRKSAAR